MTVDATAAATVAHRLTAAGVRDDDRVIVMHVSAGNPFRRWPIDHFIALAVRLVSGDPRRRIIVTSGPSEHDAAERVIAGARGIAGTEVPGGDRGPWPPPSQLIPSCGEFSLAELRALLERAALFIGGDSGPLHIAATTGVPIVGLYGPTLPVRSAPWRDETFRTVSVDAGPLPCRPCDQRVCAPGDFRCLTSHSTHHGRFASSCTGRSRSWASRRRCSSRSPSRKCSSWPPSSAGSPSSSCARSAWRCPGSSGR